MEGPQDDWREARRAFSTRANMLIALTDPSLEAIRHTGAVMIVDGDRRDMPLHSSPEGLPLVITSARSYLGTRLVTNESADACLRETGLRAVARVVDVH